MRKRIIGSEESRKSHSVVGWLSLGDLATVEITSEDAAYPIESALLPGDHSEWRAAHPGPQVIRVCFDQPQPLTRIALEFNERGAERTQQYVLRWSDDRGKSFHEIVRQQWNFSSPDAMRESEDHRVELRGVTILELAVTPDIGGGDARASLTCLRLA